MRLNAAGSASIHSTLLAAPRPAVVLGAMDTALYLELDRNVVIAVLTNDALRLPCGVVLGFSSAERSLRRLGPAPDDPPMVGNGHLQWTGDSGAGGPVMIQVVRQWAPPTVRAPGAGQITWSCGLARLRAAVDGLDLGLDPRLVDGLGAADEPSVLALLGRGPGLTPSGDDVLAGLLLGARAFGVDVRAVAAAVERYAPARTSALSAQLLYHAIAGECVREVRDLIAGPGDAGAIGAVLRIGHTSGAALAHGIVLAATLTTSRLAPASLAWTASGGGQ